MPLPGKVGPDAAGSACGDAAPDLQHAEHELDPVASRALALVVAGGFAARLPTPDAGRIPLPFNAPRMAAG